MAHNTPNTKYKKQDEATRVNFFCHVEIKFNFDRHVNDFAWEFRLGRSSAPYGVDAHEFAQTISIKLTPDLDSGSGFKGSPIASVFSWNEQWDACRRHETLLGKRSFFKLKGEESMSQFKLDIKTSGNIQIVVQYQIY